MGEMAIRRLVLFDGVCGLCDRTVRFLILIDRHRRLRFAALQSPLAKSLLQLYRINSEDMRSMVFIENARTEHERIWTQSEAVLRILREVGGVWSVVAWLRFLPSFLRDTLYDLIARHRYSWFGRTDTCHLPTPETKDRFVE